MSDAPSFETILTVVLDEVTKVCGMRPRSITQTINFDLGVAGADGYDLIVALTEQFKIQRFDFDVVQYFGHETTFKDFLALHLGEEEATSPDCREFGTTGL